MTVLALLLGCPQPHVYPDGTGLAAQLERELIAIRRRNQDLESRDCLSPEERAPDPVYSDVYQVYRGTEVEVSREGRITVVTLPGHYLFSSSGLAVREEAYMSLDLLSTALRLHPDYAVEIEGHTNDSGLPLALRARFPTNWDFAYARARAVMQKMSREFGVDPERFTLISKGESAPIASNETSSGQRKNARVVVIIRPPSRQEASP